MKVRVNITSASPDRTSAPDSFEITIWEARSACGLGGRGGAGASAWVRACCAWVLVRVRVRVRVGARVRVTVYD